MTQQISQHFSLEELTFSQAALRLGVANNPNPAQIASLKKLCDTLLEPARIILSAAVGREIALHIDSGFRTPMINSSVGGDPNSAHMRGGAADVIPIGMPLLNAFHVLRQSSLPFDRLIFECAAWLHIAIPPDGQQPKRSAELASGGPGNWRYTAVA